MRLIVASGAGVAERWRKQYEKPDGTWGTCISGSAKDVYDKLVAFGHVPTSEQVAAVIGNQSWSYARCSGCDTYVTCAVEYGEDHFALCRVCLLAGSAALEAIMQMRSAL